MSERGFHHRPAAQQNSSVQSALFVDDVALQAIAENYGTPAYVYSRYTMEAALEEYQQALINLDALLCVSVKANSNLSFLNILARKGAGFDVVSGGELHRVIAAGGETQKVVFAGVGKTDEEILFALESEIRMFNVESIPELERIEFLALRSGRTAPVALRINPDVDAQTHQHISTGREEHKFGIPLRDAIETFQNHQRYPHLKFVGIDCHIGSNIRSLDAFREAFTRVRTLVEELKSFLPDFDTIDLGGGLGVSYDGGTCPTVAEYAEIVRQSFSGLDCKLILEPGRSIFGPAGVVLTRVLYTKRANQKDFIVFDAGFNDLIRPLLYEAYHEFEPVLTDSTRGMISADLVGPICETGDCFAKERSVQRAERDDLYVIRTAGAYGFVMASNYNTRPRPPEILVDGNRTILVRPRETIRELYEREKSALSEIR